MIECLSWKLNKRRAQSIEQNEREKEKYRLMIRRNRLMHNNKPAKVNVQPVIKFKYVDKLGNTIDMEAIQMRRNAKMK